MPDHLVDRLESQRAVAADHDSRDGVKVRRNVLFGLWAARRMGLPEDEAEPYAWSVHFADLDAPGHDDVIAKVRADLETRGVPASERQLRDQLREMEQRASLHLEDMAPPRR